jgi:GntR family transcriptional regulator, galactonate operon transcriptional repressor
MKPASPTLLEKPGPKIALTSPFEVVSSLPKGFARETVETLGRWIVNDRFPPDVVIPTESQLVEALGVSRATVRDAIKVLSGKGLVRTARRYGTRVTPVEEWNLLDGDVVAWHRSDHPRMRRIFAETTEVRTILEPAAAALAAHRATETQRTMILDSARTMYPEAGDVAALFHADCVFHVTILDATRNQVMQQMRQIILTMLRVSYEYGVMRPVYDPVTRAGHVEVAEAIAAHDGPAARDAMATMLGRNARIAQSYWREITD